MMKKLLMMFVFIFLMVGIANASTILDDTEDAAWTMGSCANIEQAYDEEQSTYGQSNHGVACFVYLNYTIPSSINSAIWQTKYGGSPVVIPASTFHLGHCKNQSDGQFIELFSTAQSGTSHPIVIEEYEIPSECLISQALELKIGLDSSTTPFNEQARFYEDAVIWDIGSGANESCDYYIGDAEFNLPQITTSLVSDDSPTHKLYLACMYNSIDEGVGYEEMIDTQSCRENIETFNPTNAGDYEYALVIAFQERQWNPTSHQWETVNSGTDVSLNHEFTVCSIPGDDDGRDFFLQWISTLLCDWFGWFC